MFDGIWILETFITYDEVQEFVAIIGRLGLEHSQAVLYGGPLLAMNDEN